jgi:peptidoglycan-N-acetylglucosamine deacetylase
MLASLSLDLDNKWSYLKTHGDESWSKLPSYLDLVVPRILNMLAEFELKITFFIVGLDADQEANSSALRQISKAGHEIGNHSYRHEPWLHLYTREEIVEEFAKTEVALERVTGNKPIGFRGPGFSFSQDVLEVMKARGYQYDCSTFPTFLGPVARAYYFFRSNLNRKQREQRQALFGTVADGLRRLKPFRWRLKSDPLLEIPVTTMPVFRVPFHLSYIMFLAKRSEWLAVQYFKFALALCRLRGIEPSILLHPLDFLGADDDADLGFFPAMDIPYAKKERVLRKVFGVLKRKFQVVTMETHAASFNGRQLPSKAVPVRA